MVVIFYSQFKLTARFRVYKVKMALEESNSDSFRLRAGKLASALSWLSESSQEGSSLNGSGGSMRALPDSGSWDRTLMERIPSRKLQNLGPELVSATRSSGCVPE